MGLTVLGSAWQEPSCTAGVTPSPFPRPRRDQRLRQPPSSKKRARILNALKRVCQHPGQMAHGMLYREQPKAAADCKGELRLRMTREKEPVPRHFLRPGKALHGTSESRALGSGFCSQALLFLLPVISVFFGFISWPIIDRMSCPPCKTEDSQSQFCFLRQLQKFYCHHQCHRTRAPGYGGPRYPHGKA